MTPASGTLRDWGQIASTFGCMFAQIFETNLADCYHAPEASLLLMLWEVARDGRAMPEIGDIPRARLVYLLDDLMILIPIGNGDFFYDHYGQRIAQYSGFNMQGKKVSDFHGEIRDFYRMLYSRVCKEQRPLGSLHRLGAYGEIPSWERLILPIGGKEVEQLLVMNKVRGFAAELTQLDVAARGRGVIILQVHADSRTEIVGANTLARKALGQRSDEMIGKTLAYYFPAAHDYDLAVLMTKPLPEETTPGESGPRHHIVFGNLLLSAYPHQGNLVIEFEPAENSRTTPFA